jgi:adenylate cyclase
MPARNPFQRIVRLFLRPLSTLSNRLGNRFYIGLGIVIGAAAVFAIATGSTGAMKNKAYDLVMKARFQHPAADPDIVILDIDESTLAVMAPEYGRWPWPRNVMGELTEGIAQQQPAAIVFDIAFSDPDVFNLDGDRYFRDVIAATPNTFFPMIRLARENDPLSRLPVSRLPGVSRLDPAAPESATIAVILPYFFEVLTDWRLGTNNIYTGDDGMVRNYDLYADEYGWRVGSLPANVVAGLGLPLPPQRDILLNWRGKPLSYTRVSLHEVYTDLQRSARTRPADEFRGKIVIIGSTAPSLFDLKTTPMDKTHPGVEILAIAIDNLKRGDYLIELPPWIYILITLAAVALLTAAFMYKVDQFLINLAFTFLQSGFLAVSYLTLNFSSVFVDLTAPIAFSLAYFAAARFNYLFAGYRRSGQPFFSTMLDEGNRCHVVLAQCHIHLRNPRARLALGAKIRKQISLTRYGLATTPFFKGMPLLYSFFRHTVVLYWLAPQAKSAEMLRDVVTVLEHSLPAIRKSARRVLKDEPVATWLVHGFSFTVDAEETWRLKGEEGMAKLFALAEKAGSAKGGGAVRVRATKEFIESCRIAEGLKVSEELEKAGLKI